jgi:hypothetical protein
MSIESNWDVLIRRLLQIALASALAVLTLLVSIGWALSALREIELLADRSAWIGFWGSIFGGILSLIGSFIAAFAAVHAVQRQLVHFENQKNRSARDHLRAFSMRFISELEQAPMRFSEIRESLESGDLRRLSDCLTLPFLMQNLVSERLLERLAEFTPALAQELHVFIDAVKQLRKVGPKLMAFIDGGGVLDIYSNRKAAHFAVDASLSALNAALTARLVWLAMQAENKKVENFEKYSIFQNSLADQAASSLLKEAGKIEKIADQLSENFTRLGGNMNHSI